MISIIIPTYNEADSIGNLVFALQQHKTDKDVEIIVCDGGSTDETVCIATMAGAKTYLSPVKGRAVQMNYGASQASGEILYFIHADTLPPQTYATDIAKAIKQGYQCGRYHTRFNSSAFMLKINAFFTRFDWHICSGAIKRFLLPNNFLKALMALMSL